MYIKLILCLFTVFAISTASAYDSNDRNATLFPGMSSPFMVDLTLPPDFIVISTNPKEKPNLIDGVAWGAPQDLQNLINKTNVPCQSRGIAFIVKNSKQTLQIGPSTFSDEENIDKGLEKTGLRNIRKRKIAWGLYPVLEVQARLPNGKPFCMAWVGLNTNGRVITISGCFFDDPYVYDNGLRIWDALMNYSSAITTDTLKFSKGCDVKPGITYFEGANAKINIHSEWVQGGKISVLLDNLTPNNYVQIAGSRQNVLLDPGRLNIDLTIMIVSTIENRAVTRETIVTIQPIHATSPTLKGKRVYEDDHIIGLLH